jgi:hypothetical protein
MASFNNSFAAARKAGKSTFMWNGKKYNTKMASSSTPKKGPVPKAKPSQAKPAAAPAKPRPVQGPQPAKAVGIARPNSPIAKAAARQANAPKAPSKPPTGLSAKPSQIAAGVSARKAKEDLASRKQGPQPEGVWYAKKGSPMSIGAARRANAPKPKKRTGGGW